MPLDIDSQPISNGDCKHCKKTGVPMISVIYQPRDVNGTAKGKPRKGKECTFCHQISDV